MTLALALLTAVPLPETPVNRFNDRNQWVVVVVVEEDGAVRIGADSPARTDEAVRKLLAREKQRFTQAARGRNGRKPEIVVEVKSAPRLKFDRLIRLFDILKADLDTDQLKFGLAEEKPDSGK